MKSAPFFFITVLAFGVAFISTPFSVYAGGTYYVDEDGESGADGDKDDPFNDIADAIKKDPDKIKVSSGTYKESFTLPKGATLEGSGRGKVTIQGKITMKDGAKVKDLTVTNGGIIATGKATIEDVTIKKSGTGIVTEGGGDLIVRDTKITDNGKGMYIQKGKDVDIRNSEVYKNDEEGIDIRANVDGVIAGNAIYNNGESGIEVILGSSQLVVSGNNIKSNRASGIAAQYYKSAKKLGGLVVKGNTLSKNKDYGLNCKLPSGGNPARTYWTESISFSGNAVAENKAGSFAGACYFEERKEEFALLTEEEQAGVIATEKKEEAERIAAQVEAQKKAEEERQRLLQEAQTREQERIARQDALAQQITDAEAAATDSAQSSADTKNTIAQRSPLLTRFFGISRSQENALVRQRVHVQEQITALTPLMQQSTSYAHGHRLMQTREKLLQIQHDYDELYAQYAAS